ncbi:glycosyltransferase [Pseudomonas sp. TCU-HL1]|uniref:glycosyltransferase n=1 Tax=Pseudomonas sp. TCU-HL1 TaxID=1856685 RepID=UPI00083D7872|nr:glycosyltransferase [Pseudomonas sp. TCU-HL1]AOE84530.1 hypothetical protein THL1_1982 [Pseudomonas sp. TCU-HL1]
MKVYLIALCVKVDEAIGSIRPENWAGWLSREHEVTVIARELKGADDANDEFSVVRPASLLMRILEWMSDCRRNGRLNSQVKSEKNSSKEAFDDMASTPAGVFFCRMPCLYDIWFFACYRALRKNRPELIVANHSHYVGLVVAWIYSLLNPQAKLWVDFRDLWVGNHLAIGIGGGKRFEKWFELRMLRRADVISTVSEGLES